MTTINRTMAAVAALALVSAPAYAQSINSGANGAYGQVELRSGYEPDPYMVTVLGGGPVDATSVDAECNGGFIAQRPSFTLRYTAGELPLFIGANSDADTTIAVRAPNGAWSCNDDSNGLNPMVMWESPRSGRYQIWVGRFGVSDESALAMLYISEVGAAGGPGGGGGDAPDWSMDPAYGAIELVSGFEPDPHTVAIDAGGTIDASAALPQAGCVGWIARAPDYRVNWTAGSGELPLIFSVASDSDTTLVINDSQGNWHCDDDGGNEGLNPAITITSPPSGQYDIWVGTYMQGELQASTLHVSELYSQ